MQKKSSTNCHDTIVKCNVHRIYIYDRGDDWGLQKYITN